MGTIVLSDEEKEFMREHNKIAAITVLRKRFPGLGLLDAKNAVEGKVVDYDEHAMISSPVKIGPEPNDEEIELAMSGRVLMAIKQYRNRNNLGLKDCLYAFKDDDGNWKKFSETSGIHVMEENAVKKNNTKAIKNVAMLPDKPQRKLKSAEERQALKEKADKIAAVKTIEREYNDGKKLSKNAVAVLNKLNAADLKEVQKMIGEIAKNNEWNWSE